MTSLDKWGGGASVFLAASYIFGFALFIGVIDRSGYSGPAGDLAFVADNHGLLTLALIVLYPIAACALAILVAALRRRAQEDGSGSSGLASAADVAAIFGVVWVALLMASGFIGIAGMQSVISTSAGHPDLAIASWASVTIIQDALGGGIELVGGVWMALASYIALRQGLLPVAAAWLGYGIGLAGVLTVIPAFAPLVNIFGLGQIVWFAWLGWKLWRDAPPAQAASRE